MATEQFIDVRAVRTTLQAHTGNVHPVFGGRDLRSAISDMPCQWALARTCKYSTVHWRETLRIHPVRRQA
jgi:hypothetical protein